jgi:ribosome-associated protein
MGPPDDSTPPPDQAAPDKVLRVNSRLAIPLGEIEWRFGPSGGPGGQHANKANTRAEARFDVAGSPSLDDRDRERLLERLGPEVRSVADEERSQVRNRALALDRLAARLAAALVVERPRRATKPTRASKQRRLDDKRKRAEIKQARRRPGDDT